MAQRIVRELDQLVDVDTAGVADGDALVYDDANSIWIPGAGGVGGAFSLGASNLGNTLGQTGVTGSRVVLAGIGNLTLSQLTDANGGTISISGGTAAGAGFSAGVSGGNAAGDTGATGTRLVFAGGQSITLSQATDANGGTVTISGASTSQSAQTQSRFNLTLAGNTAGALALISSGVMTLAGGNNITLSQNGNAVTISGANVGGAQTGISGIVGSDATYTSGTVVMTGSGIVTVRSSAGQRVVIDASQSVQPETQTFVGGIANSETTYTSGTVNLSGLGALTVRSTTGNAFQLSVNAQSVQPETQTFVGGLANSQTTYTSGTIGLSELGAVTIRSTTGNQFQISVNAQSVQPETQTFLAGIIASDTTYTSGSVRFTGVGGGITVSSNTGQRVDLSVAAPVAQTVQSLGMYAVQNTTGQSSSTTMDARTLSVAGDGAVSVGYSAGSLRISAPTQTVQTQGILSAGVSTGGNTLGNTQVSTGSRLVIAGAGMITASQATAAGASTITLSATQSVQSLGMYAVQNTTGQSSSTTMDARTLSVAGDGAVSVGYSAGSLRISAPVQTVQTQNVHNVTLSGNTAGAMAQISSGTMTLAGGNNITLSQNGNAVTISGGAGGGFSAGVSTIGNTGGATGVTGTRMVLVGSNNVTLSQTTDANGATVSLFGQAPAGGAFSAGVSNLGNTAGATGITGTQLVWVGSGVMSLSQTTGANGGTVSILAPATSSLVGTNGVSVSTNGSTISVMDETRTFFAPYDEAPMVTGQQGQQTIHVMPMWIPNLAFDRILVGVQISNVTNSSNSITLTQYVGIYTKNASTISLLASTSTAYNFSGSGTVGSYSLYGGPRQLSIPWTTTLTGSDYYVAMNIRTTTGGGAGHSISQLLQSKFTNSDWSGLLGAASTLSAQRLLGQGVYSATSAGLPNSMAFTDIRGTGSLVLRAPIFHFRSGTV